MTGMNEKNRTKKFDCVFFWEISRRFLEHEFQKSGKRALIQSPPTVLRSISVSAFWRVKKESGVSGYVLMIWIKKN